MADSQEEGGQDRSQLIAHFQEITGIEDDVKSVEHLSGHQWNLEAAVQDALNEREGIHPVFGGRPTNRPTTNHNQAMPVPPPPSPPRSPDILRAGNVRVGGGVVQRREGAAGGWLEWTMNLAILPLRFVLNAANELFQFAVNLIFGFQPTPAKNPLADVQQFVKEFEAEYGRKHPPFLVKSYEEALSEARQDLKFILVYLHSPGHQDTERFCKEVICSQELIDFTAANMLLLLGISVNTEEGVHVSYILRESTYPFLALIVLKQNRLIVCERIEGSVNSPAELITRLRQAIADNEGELVVERTERFRRAEDQQLRESQDQAYMESLAADQEKAKQREEAQKKVAEQEREAREQVDEQQRKKLEFEIKRAICVSRLPPEPDNGDPTSITVLLKLPSGERLERRFRDSDRLQSVYDFAYTDESGHLPLHFTLVTNFPRKELCTDENGGPPLNELGLGRRCALFIQDDDDTS